MKKTATHELNILSLNSNITYFMTH